MVTAVQALLGFAVLAAALHGVHASLSLSASLTSTQTIDGQWVDVSTGNRFVCTESQGGTFECTNTRIIYGNLRNYHGQASKSAIPRVYVSGAQEFAGGSFIPYDASDFRFVLSADGKSLSNCYTVSSFYSSLPFFPCNTWNKLSAIEGFAWSFSGAIPGMTCVNLNEPSEASSDTWFDNYFCSINDRGLKWSANGALAGMKCTLINEPADGNAAAWNNNYICLPSTSTITFVWSSSGPLDSKTCTRWYEPNESAAQSWDDNYLCY